MENARLSNKAGNALSEMEDVINALKEEVEALEEIIENIRADNATLQEKIDSI